MIPGHPGVQLPHPEGEATWLPVSVKHVLVEPIYELSVRGCDTLLSLEFGDLTSDEFQPRDLAFSLPI